MAKPFLRYLPAKLKPLSAPAVWIPLTVATLLGILLWEYYNHPEWFDRDPITNANPESTLTPDEQAKLSEIDTVDLLLQGAQVSGPLSAQETDLENVSELNPTNLGTDAAGTSRQLANRSDPFGAYAAEYEFPGASQANSGTPNRPSQPSTSTGASATPFNFGSSTGSPSLPTAPSALSNAIDQQQAAKAEEAQRSADSAQPLSQSNIDAAAPFIRTTPAMSPPVGTTGYQTPATSSLSNFNVAPTQTTPNPLNLPAAPAAGTIAPGQIGTVQPSPIARPIQSSPVPAGSSIYTAPSSTQPEQNRRAR